MNLTARVWFQSSRRGTATRGGAFGLARRSTVVSQHLGLAAALAEPQRWSRPELNGMRLGIARFRERVPPPIEAYPPDATARPNPQRDLAQGAAANGNPGGKGFALLCYPSATSVDADLPTTSRIAAARGQVSPLRGMQCKRRLTT